MTSGDTTQRFFRSAGAATFSQFWRVGVTFVTTLLLMRLVSPEDWGLYEWSLVVFTILSAVRDLGLVYHIVRLKRRPWGSLLAVEAGWGLLLVAAALLAAPLLAAGFREPHPDVVAVIRAFTLYLFFDGISAVPRIYFDAELRVGRTVLPEILRNLIFASVSLVMAYLGYGVWSLVTGQVVSVVYYAAHLWIRAWPTMPLVWDKDGLWGLISPSLPLACIWLLAILTQHIDPLILGARFDIEGLVGNYTRAYFFAFLIARILVPAVTRVLYPALVAYSSEPRRLLEAYRLATLFVLAVEAPVAAFLLLNPDTLFSLFGDRWVEAPRFLRILALAPLVDPFSRLGGEILKVYHRDRVWIAALATTLLSFVTVGIWLTGAIGAEGMAWANFMPFGGLIMAWGIHRIAPQPFRRLLRDIGIIYLAPLLPFLAAFLIAGDNLWLRFGLSALAGAVTLIFYLRRFGRAFAAFFRDPVTTAGA